MKLYAGVLLLAFCVLNARADSWLQNGDFSSASDHWYGEAKWPTDFAPPDPFTKADPFTSQGMVVPLKSSQWMKEFQDFKGHASDAELVITYVVSPDLAFSQRPDDYENVPEKIGWNAWESFNSPPGAFIIFVSELEERKGTYYLVQPKLGTGDVQTYRSHLTGTPWTQKTMALVFPPGTGTIVIKSVQLNDAAPSSDQ